VIGMSDDRQQAIETAFLAAAATKAFSEIDLSAVAAEAGASLADVRRLYDGPLDVLAAFARRIDVAVIEGTDASLASEPARERLFDALMRRFDLLAPHRAGLAGLRRSARRDPVLAMALARLVVGSQAWVLRSAGISTGGLVGRLRAPALAAALARIVPVFLAEEDAGLPKTMAALDEALTSLGKAEARVTDVTTRLGRWWSRCRAAAATPAGATEAGGDGDATSTPGPAISPHEA
jgi:hypothetical protein